MCMFGHRNSYLGSQAENYAQSLQMAEIVKYISKDVPSGLLGRDRLTC